MRIEITLPPDRVKPGTLYVIGDDGEPQWACPCLGKADGRKAHAEHNFDRDPTRPWGDTPAGVYGPTRVVWYEDVTDLGEAAIPLPLEGVAGRQAIAARANGRSGLYIHAGRGNGRLRPSFGCLRLKFDDFVNVLYLVRGNEFTVSIAEEPKG